MKRNHLGQFTGGVSYWKGKKFTDEMKENLSKAHKGKKHSKATKKKMGKAHKGDKAHNWKGDKVGYYALHSWVKRWKGIPKKCKHCGATNKERKIHWANIDHKYKRKLSDYIELCVSCHKKYDLKNKLCKH